MVQVVPFQIGEARFPPKSPFNSLAQRELDLFRIRRMRLALTAYLAILMSLTPKPLESLGAVIWFQLSSRSFVWVEVWEERFAVLRYVVGKFVGGLATRDRMERNGVKDWIYQDNFTSLWQEVFLPPINLAKGLVYNLCLDIGGEAIVS